MLALALLLAAAAPDCSYDRAAIMALDQNALDQDDKGGWRALQMRGCLAEAADLLRDYRDAKPRPDPSILFWHEGQLRAVLGQTERAIVLLDAARQPAADDHFGWNLYVNGTIAFLRRDRPALQKARDTLAALPPPASLMATRPDGTKVKIEWPPNLRVLDGFLQCFDRPYREAYGSKACTPSRPPSS